ncbi:DUF1799 domain-containing protein [Photorhabdus temperata]|uniref:Phage protein n=1 Tax=Photorhabdus temperata subsp. temperata Meg1 TaxID=1393735 RepID=A0A081RS62_PHOTE|nr:DUF1799 domain-containing protein [Photorhabdus temperata]KER01515.1 Phage related hypothetical protein (DUF1799) [Photorhabdus temperata subsp. temperata Meg1]MCT8349517.1 DUF1799 domain-containing protein [Photorhabdus temperata]
MLGDIADDVEVWPDVWESFLTFQALSTQWRVGAAGATGLDYNVLHSVMDLIGVNDRATVFNDIRVMEREALIIMHSENS